MHWEESVFALFDDLEQQAEGLHAEQQVEEVRSLAEAGYAEVVLASRLQASRGRALRAVLGDGTEVRGRLARAGIGWMLIAAPGSEWILPSAGVCVLDGLSASSLPERLWPIGARLSVRSALRAIARTGDCTTLLLEGGRRVEGRLTRVAEDFVEVRSAGSELVVPIAAIAAVRGTS